MDIKGGQKIRKSVGAIRTQRVSETKKESTEDPKKKETRIVQSSSSSTNIRKPKNTAPIDRKKQPIEPVKKTKIGNPTVLPQRTTPAPLKSTLNDRKKPAQGNFNVTVFSPPSKRRTESSSTAEPVLPRDRTRTRTLRPEEVTVLRNVTKNSGHVPREPHKPPVSFDVDFIDKKAKHDSPSIEKVVVQTAPEEKINDNASDNDQYSSDSYESDFDSGSSRNSPASSSNSSSSSSDLEQFPDTTDDMHEKVPHNKEQQLDSGNYDMKVKQIHGTSKEPTVTLKPEDNQPDSGMNSGLFDTNITSLKILEKRHIDIFGKITLNVMAFELFEQHPAPYEYFSQNVDSRRVLCNYTQTETECFTVQTQTNDIFQRSCWIQYPPQFSKDVLTKTNTDFERYTEEIVGIGYDRTYSINNRTREEDVFSTFLLELETRNTNKVRKRLVDPGSINRGQLHKFLRKVTVVIEVALNRKRRSNQHSPKMVEFKQHEMLKNSIVTSVRCYANLRHVFLTLHQCHEAGTHHRFFICIWNARNCHHPEVVLSCWSSVVCTEKVGPVVIAGTSCGTLCTWDVEEHNEGDVPMQMTTAAISRTQHPENNACIVSIKSVNLLNCSKLAIPAQILTLLENGVLITWTLSMHDHYMHEANERNLTTVFHNAKYRLDQQRVLNVVSLLVKKMSVNANYSSISNNNYLQKRKYGYQKRTMQPSDRSGTIYFNDMVLQRNHILVTSNTHLILINQIEQKCVAMVEHEYRLTTTNKNPITGEFILTCSSDNTIKVLKMFKDDGVPQRNSATEKEKRNFSSNLRSNLSPVLNDKSCAIQNIVKNERKLYQNSSTHQTSSVDLNNANGLLNREKTLPKSSIEPKSFHHNQIIFLKHVQLFANFALFLLDRSRKLCVSTGNDVRLIDLQTGRKDKLLDSVTQTDISNYRLLGVTDKKAIMMLDGQTLLLFDLAEQFDSS